MANEMNWSRMFQPPGVAGLTSAPSNVDEDLPPGAPPYAGGPLANPPRPSPTPPQTNSLTVLANGGTNHQEAWMAGQSSPQSLPQQRPFNSQEPDLPPGAPPYYGGPLATIPPPKPPPTPKPDMNLLKRFTWSSSFDQQPQY